MDEDGNPRLVSDSKNVKKAVTDTAEGTSGVGSDEKNREYPPLNSAFVTFERQISAHLAVQVLSHHEPYRMSWVLLWGFLKIALRMLILFFI